MPANIIQLFIIVLCDGIVVEPTYSNNILKLGFDYIEVFYFQFHFIFIKCKHKINDNLNVYIVDYMF